MDRRGGRKGERARETLLSLSKSNESPADPTSWYPLFGFGEYGTKYLGKFTRNNTNQKIVWDEPVSSNNNISELQVEWIIAALEFFGIYSAHANNALNVDVRRINENDQKPFKPWEDLFDDLLEQAKRNLSINLWCANELATRATHVIQMFNRYGLAAIVGQSYPRRSALLREVTKKLPRGQTVELRAGKWLTTTAGSAGNQYQTNYAGLWLETFSKVIGPNTDKEMAAPVAVPQYLAGPDRRGSERLWQWWWSAKGGPPGIGGGGLCQKAKHG